MAMDYPVIMDMVLPLHRMKDAVSADVDLLTGNVYWTDSVEGTINMASPDGKIMETVIYFDMELPDGIAIDSIGRKVFNKNV